MNESELINSKERPIYFFKKWLSLLGTYVFDANPNGPKNIYVNKLIISGLLAIVLKCNIHTIEVKVNYRNLLGFAIKINVLNDC